MPHVRPLVFALFVGMALSAAGCGGTDDDPDDDLAGDWTGNSGGDEEVAVSQEQAASTQPTKRMRTLRDAIQEKWKVPYGVGCVRSDPLPDHPSGRACDFMVARGKMPTNANRAIGQNIASFAKDNAVKYGVEYVIYRQKIWSYARRSEGWRAMSNRGSVTANHYDHVHITVNR